MKRLLTFCIIFIIEAVVFGFSAYAYHYEPVKAVIEVEITLGGTVTIIPNVNCPIPEKTEMNLQNGEIGKFDIYFTEVGVFDYTVKTIPDGRDLEFDKKVYNIKIYVTDNDGVLAITYIVLTGEGKYDADQVRLKFDNTVHEENTSTVSTSVDDGVSSNNNNRNPKTEDDTKMETYFLFAMLSSAGLLVLSIVYLIDTQKIVNGGTNNE